MIFYHGTNMIIGEINLEKSRKRVDFGKGFYLTDKYGTAKNWAVRKVELEGEGIPTVLYYEINPDVFKLHGQRFPNDPDLEWLHFICSNRRNDTNSKKEPRHDLNWISGPIADDKVVDVVAEYIRGEITDEEAIRRAKALPQTYQLSLHTQDAVDFANEVNVLYRQFKNGRWSKDWITRKS